MKKVLFATTALVATAGVASADISLSGVAQMGLQGGTDNRAGVDPVFQFVQDIDITFTMSGETDNGLTFGAAIDLDENAGAVGLDDGGVAIFLSGDWGTVTMGDTDGAFDWALTEVATGAAASINDDHTTHAGYSGNSGLDGAYDGQILRYDYAIAGFGVAVSVEQDDETTRTGNFAGVGAPTGTSAGDPIIGVGANYSGDFGGTGFTVGVGYQFTSDYAPQTAGSQELSIIGGSVSVELAFGLTVTGNYSQINSFVANGDGTHYAVGAAYNFDAITVGVNYGQFDWGAGAAAADSTGIGASASYDLGGGLSLHAGYGYSDITAVNASASTIGQASTFSLGLNMAF